MSDDTLRRGEVMVHMLTADGQDYFAVCNVNGTPAENTKAVTDMVTALICGANDELHGGNIFAEGKPEAMHRLRNSLVPGGEGACMRCIRLMNECECEATS